MNNEVEIHGGSTETPPNDEPKKGWWRNLLAGSWFSYEDKDKKNNWLNEMRGNLSLVATVIATMTFQMALNPPGGVRSKEDVTTETGDANPPGAYASAPAPDNSESHFAGEAVLATVFPDQYYAFLVFNTICFIASLSICLLLVSGIRFNHRFPMWLLSIGMCVTLTSLALSYITAVEMTTPNHLFDSASNFLERLIGAWVLLLAFICLCLTVRLVTWGVKVFRQRTKNPKTQKITKETPIC